MSVPCAVVTSIDSPRARVAALSRAPPLSYGLEPVKLRPTVCYQRLLLVFRLAFLLVLRTGFRLVLRLTDFFFVEAFLFAAAFFL